MPHSILRRYMILLLLLAACAPTVSPTPKAALPTGLVIAWVDHEKVFVQLGNTPAQSITVPGVSTLRLAPDGQQLAFIREPNPDTTLWVWDITSETPRQLVATAQLETGDPLQIETFGWLDQTTLLFTTYRPSGMVPTPQNDLWRVNVPTSTTERLLLSGQGGHFFISPNRQLVVVVYPGTYGNPDGQIILFDPATGKPLNELTFTGISSASSSPFYPLVFWESEGAAVRVALPDPDLIYNETAAPPTSLWRLPVDGSPAQTIGSVTASFFGQPVWSDDGSLLLYLQRSGATASNTFDLMIAEGAGTQPQTYLSGISLPQLTPAWLPLDNAFYYGLDQPGTVWLGRLDSQPQPLPKAVFSPLFLHDTSHRYVYATAPVGPFELRLGQVSSSETPTLASSSHPLPIFDAVILP